MIRPLTIVTFLMASGSGLYLYQSKHEVQLLDKTIERTVHETSTLRDQSRLLAAEWTMLNDPERLRQFSDSFLSLRTIAPSQFTSLADLDSRLPAVHIEPPHVEEVPVAAVPGAPPSEAAPAEPDSPAVAEEQEDLPVPPMPAAPPMVAAAPRPPVEHKVAAPRPAEPAPPRAVATAEPRPTELHPARPPENRAAEARTAEAKPAEMHASAAPPRPPLQARQAAPAPVVAMAPKPAPVVTAAPRPAPPAPQPAAVATASPYGGSLLGMARGTMAPTPRPMPVSSTQWSNTN